MKTHKYKNYAEYVAAQKAGFKRKQAKTWVEDENIKFLAEYLKPRNPKKGLCHGTRGGYEQNWFIRHIPGCKVRGTEIGAYTAKLTIPWDFNMVNPLWLQKYDFLYSNSFDHAYNPGKTILVWAEQVKPGGVIILEWSDRHEHTGKTGKKYNATDPVSITLNELIEKIPIWISGAKIIDVLDLPIVRHKWQKAVVVEVGA